MTDVHGLRRGAATRVQVKRLLILIRIQHKIHVSGIEAINNLRDRGRLLGCENVTACNQTSPVRKDFSSPQKAVCPLSYHFLYSVHKLLVNLTAAKSH